MSAPLSYEAQLRAAFESMMAEGKLVTASREELAAAFFLSAAKAAHADCRAAEARVTDLLCKVDHLELVLSLVRKGHNLTDVERLLTPKAVMP